jgi:hypothetical protein
VNSLTPKERATNAVLRTIGVKRIAAWCGVSEATPYQWLSRGTDEYPIPPKWVPIIIRNAKAEGLEVEWADLWPGSELV